MTTPDGAPRHGPYYVASVVALYWVVSISMVFLNKLLMTNGELSIPAPLFVTWWQSVVTAVMCYVGGLLGERYRKSNQSEASLKPFAGFPPMQYNLDLARKTIQLSLIFVGMITFNSLCLTLVEVSFYNVARSLSLLFNAAFSYLLLGSVISRDMSLCLLLVVIGFYVGSEGEVHFSMVGTVCGVISSLFVALNSIYTKKVLPTVQNNMWTLTFLNNVNASLLFLPAVVLVERRTLWQHADKLFSPVFWLGMLVSGVLGFSIGSVTVLQIKATSPLTHNISGTAKSAVQSIMAMYIWGTEATAQGLAGIALVLLGSCLYTASAMGLSSAPARPATSAAAAAAARRNRSAVVNNRLLAGLACMAGSHFVLQHTLFSNSHSSSSSSGPFMMPRLTDSLLNLHVTSPVTGGSRLRATLDEKPAQVVWPDPKPEAREDNRKVWEALMPAPRKPEDEAERDHRPHLGPAEGTVPSPEEVAAAAAAKETTTTPAQQQQQDATNEQAEETAAHEHPGQLRRQQAAADVQPEQLQPRTSVTSEELLTFGADSAAPLQDTKDSTASQPQSQKQQDEAKKSSESLSKPAAEAKPQQPPAQDKQDSWEPRTVSGATAEELLAAQAGLSPSPKKKEQQPLSHKKQQEQEQPSKDEEEKDATAKPPQPEGTKPDAASADASAKSAASDKLTKPSTSKDQASAAADKASDAQPQQKKPRKSQQASQAETVSDATAEEQKPKAKAASTPEELLASQAAAAAAKPQVEEEVADASGDKKAAAPKAQRQKPVVKVVATDRVDERPAAPGGGDLLPPAAAVEEVEDEMAAMVAEMEAAAAALLAEAAEEKVAQEEAEKVVEEAVEEAVEDELAKQVEQLEQASAEVAPPVDAETPKPTLSPEQEHLESFDQDWESFPPEELPEHCGVSDVFYWNKHPQKLVDNPWAKLGPKKKYVAFMPDQGGWNNMYVHDSKQEGWDQVSLSVDAGFLIIFSHLPVSCVVRQCASVSRMAMETVLVFALATGRTLVMPPRQGMYLLGNGKEVHHNVLHFSDFFYLHRIQEKLDVIEMEDFLKLEALPGNLKLPLPDNRTDLNGQPLWTYLQNASHTMRWDPWKVCVTFPEEVGKPIDDHSEAQREVLKRFCGDRKPVIYDEKLQNEPVLYFGGRDDLRVLIHFYAYEHFMDPALDNYIKRIVRDYIHYRDEVFCAAGRIIGMMEAMTNHTGYKAMHIRRGELQYPEVKIPAKEIIETTSDTFSKGDIVYLSTDEKDEAYLAPLREHFQLYLLADFYEKIGLSRLNQNYIGMVEQIVCARSKVFAGTYFSTFTGYITRMRGYYGYDYHTNWFHYIGKKTDFQNEFYPTWPFYMREWPAGWHGIDDE